MKNSIQFFKFGLRCDVEHPAKWTGLHSHDEVECLFFMTDEPVRIRIGAENLELSKNDTILFWGSIPHQLISVDPAAWQHWFTVPTQLFLHWSVPDFIRKGILNGRVLIERDQELRSVDLVAFPLWKKESESAREDFFEALSLSIEARLFRFGGERARQAVLRTPELPLYVESKDKSSFSVMYNYIVEEYKRPIRIADIAKRAGLNENYAISLFKAKCGISIVEFINMLRVYEAQRLLLTCSLSIIDVAMEAGFNSVSNFYRCFRKTCGKNPKEYRRHLNLERGPSLRRRATKIRFAES